MKHAMNRSLTLVTALTTALTVAALAGCDGSSKVGELDSDATRPELSSVEIGRLVDVYSFRRVDKSIGDRRIRTNRRLELVASNVVVNANIESQSLFDAAGNAVATANYQFLPFDKTIGHEELLILWDDTAGGEEETAFKNAFASAQQGLNQIPPSYRGQNTQTRPIPIVPRNAAIKLRFTGAPGVDAAFFAANPAAIQLLEFKGDPNVVQPVDAFRVLTYRVIPSGDAIILDTTILGGEATVQSTSPGLPLSADNTTANIRIAIPSRGGVVPTFYVREDSVPDLNDVDSAGRPSVIRDFRSGNLNDGVAGRLREPEAPMIVSSLTMGITDVDTTNNIVTVNKRLQFVPVRARYPFVDGPLGTNGIPLGPLAAPVQPALETGDFLTQTIQVETSPGIFEAVSLRAEILENLEIGAKVTDPVIGLALTPEPGDTGQGELETTVRLRVGSVFAGRDKNGNLQRFRSNSLPTGQDCVVRARYYEEVPFSGSSVDLSDTAWRSLFVRIEPKPAQATVDVQPNSSVSVEFTKPMDLDQIDPTKNLLITSQPSTGALESFEQQMSDPKRATSRVVPTRLSDLSGDGTVLRLQPPLGFFHNSAAPNPEVYSFHVRTGASGVTDLAGNPLNLFDSASNPQASWTVSFSLAAAATSNSIAWKTYLFESEDEDGTLPGSVDIFGQYRLENGRLVGASGLRFGRSADQVNLSQISRITRGECWLAAQAGPPPVPAGVLLPVAPIDQGGFAHPGNLYWNPRMSDSIGPTPVPAPQVYEYWQILPQPVGRVVEPLKPQGSRMQMRYIEDDFSLSYRQPSDFGLDVEQLYWSPFNDETVLYDVFDRFTMSLGHSRRRPDEWWSIVITPNGPECRLGCQSMNSALSEVFADNVLEGTSMVPVFEDKVYKINPNEAFRTLETVKYVPFPRFDQSYTWRDSRLVTVDSTGNVIGLGGALQPDALTGNDWTAKIDSPWIQSVPEVDFANAGFSTWVEDPADFVGSNQRDHDPIALPLLVDFKVFADDPSNGFVNGNNGFQVACVGPPSYGFGLPQNLAGGYYDQLPAGCPGRPAWPATRAHASGGFDLISGNPVLVDPANVLSAQQSVVKDAGLGEAVRALFTAPPRDGMLNWARADFVRKVSTMTFGFFDTLRPQQAFFVDASQAVTQENGTPDLLAVDPNLRISEVVIQMDPPQARQPAGTSVLVEMRGAITFGTPATLALYNPSFGPNANDTFDGRGNLLNANYACEAYRYSTANNAGAARVSAEGMTRYVTEDQLNLIRDPATQLLPRFMNMRIVMNNNVDVSPTLSPSLRSMSVVYRTQPNQ